MNNCQSNFTTTQIGERMKELNIDDLKSMAQKVVVGSTGMGKQKRWFERLMNKFGWYRSSEWYMIDSSNLSFQKSNTFEKRN